ncbi:MAG: hypothetical protein PHG05_02480 [Candidatus Nanoarchaeia archaeon]|nr:hypothetical protein [Candidatus Nanoarchaeia archaeon]
MKIEITTKNGNSKSNGKSEKDKLMELVEVLKKNDPVAPKQLKRALEECLNKKLKGQTASIRTGAESIIVCIPYGTKTQQIILEKGEETISGSGISLRSLLNCIKKIS